MGADVRRLRVVLETERYRIVGNVTLPDEGWKSRLSDLLNRQETVFIAVTDVTLSGRNGSEPQHLPFMAVARDHVQIAYEAD